MSRVSAARRFLSLSVALLSLAGAVSPRAYANSKRGDCPTYFATQISKTYSDTRLTRIEADLAARPPALGPQEQLTEEIEILRKKNPELAARVIAARRAKERGESLRLDLSHLPTKMVNFLEGTYDKVIGPRGFSKPFVEITAPDKNTLLIHHAEDQFPLMIRWKEDLTSVRETSEAPCGNQICRLLELPAYLTSKHDLATLHPRHIYELASASRLHPYISNEGSTVSKIASLLHEGKLIFDRPSQMEFDELRQALDTEPALRSSVRSVLFDALTAVGKTRIIGKAVTSKINSTRKALLKDPDYSKKLTILLTKTPDLTQDLAREVGTQLLGKEVGSRNFRLIQWGGKNSEEGTLRELIDFVHRSKVPVVLVTSYPTLGARARSPLIHDLFQSANGLVVDEAHNATGNTFKRVMKVAHDIAQSDRDQGNVLNSLDILGLTASPVTRTQRAVELFDATYWASVDRPSTWIRKHDGTHPAALPPGKSVLEWKRIQKQYANARNRGEITAPEEYHYFLPREHGHDFDTIFKRGERGTQWSVNSERLKQIWPDLSKMIENHGTGFIQTYPRDADRVAETLSVLSSKNFVSLNKKGLNQNERAAIYEAFRNQTEYQGRRIDGIVGTIREGLDFPKAGWYMSLKKYVRFPENLQGPGRAFRLALDKLPPKVIFFGTEADREAYREVSEFVLPKMGRLPRKLGDRRLFHGMRKGQVGPAMANAIADLNVSMEALTRIRQDLAKELGDPKKLNPDAVARLQEVVRDARRSKFNLEVADGLTDFVSEVNSYPFFKGSLQATWKYCEKLLQAAKKGESALPKTFTPEDRALLQDPEMMEKVREFREMFSWIGPVPRTVLANMNLRPNNVSEVAKAVNTFVARNGRLPLDESPDPTSLAQLMREAVHVSPNALRKGLDYQARYLLDGVFSAEKDRPFEEALQEHFRLTKSLPKFGYKTLHDTQRTAAESLGNTLSERLDAYLRNGTLETSLLGKEVQSELDRSEIFRKAADAALEKIQISAGDLGELLENEFHRFNPGFTLTYDFLKARHPFEVLRVIEKLDEAGLPEARRYREEIETLLKTFRLYK